MTAEFKDHFSAHARDYREFRPDYPPELFEFLASVSPGRTLAWDCGTGNGQAAIALAKHFDRVVATDASAEQIAQAASHPRVDFAVAPAERSPLADSSADLIAVAQALHWFDHDRFYAEVRRVARPGGLLAATCYYEPSVSPEVDPVLRRWEDFIRPYWTPERAWVDAGYRTIPFPFPAMVAPRFKLSLAATLTGFIGYLGTWSATKAYIKEHGANPVERFESKFARAWGKPTRVRKVTWQFNVRLGRVQ
jgi:SAM-dependent methyltransferase